MEVGGPVVARYCSLCDARFEGEPEACPFDGAATFRIDDRDRNLGRTLAHRYTLVEVLGSGGMGTVYRARQRSMERDVAVKLLKPERMNDPDAIRRFFQEARASSRLTNPHVITLHDFGQAADGQFFLVMELLVGRSLADHRISRGGRLPTEEVVEVIDQVLEAIENAHCQGVVHRDLKPDNIFLLDSPPGFVKVLDFGLARILDLEARVSDPNLLFGTPAYMSPEQAKGKAVDHRSDLYALGVILFELLTGQLPFQASSSLAILLKKFHRSAPRVRDLLPASEVPPALDALVASLLATDPNRRPQTASEARRLLGAAVPARESRVGPTVVVPIPDIPSRPTPLPAPSTTSPMGLENPLERGQVSRHVPFLMTSAIQQVLREALQEGIPRTGKVWWLYQSSMGRVRSPGARALINGLLEMVQRERQRLARIVAEVEQGDAQWTRRPEDPDSLDPAGMFDVEIRRSPEEILADRDLQGILEEVSGAERELREQWERWALRAVGGPDMEFFSRRLVRCRERVSILDEASLRLLGLTRGAGLHSLYMRLAGLLPVQRVQSGEVLFREGEAGDTMVVVVRGQLKAYRDVERSPESRLALAMFQPGDVIGEMACLDPAPRSATVEAYNDAEVCLLDRVLLHELRQHDPLSWMGVLRTVGTQLVRRIRQASEILDTLQRSARRDGLVLPVLPRTLERRIPEEVREVFGTLGTRRVLESGQWFWHEGDGAWGAALVLQGSLTLHLQHEGAPRQAGRIEEGNVVGLMGLLDQGPRLCSVQAVGPCEVMDLDRTTFQMLLDSGHGPTMEALAFLVDLAIRSLRVSNDWVEWFHGLSRERPTTPTPSSGILNARPLGTLLVSLAEWGLEVPPVPGEPSRHRRP
ncbi:MAG TPA: cyclic nucleotide-binding domain-containing protein [Myxococcota bacterium]|nr:cyclic nucleotide-binding domain-containing protein [Myxococcota bacterium]HQK51816.1 cyclic nucleotide-binding domain-containing protein [Myxococcota bacterium]